MSKIPFRLIAELAATPGKNAKLELLSRHWKDGERVFFHACHMAFSPLTTFGVKTVIEFVGNEEPIESETTYEEFTALCERLATRALSGSAAKEAIEDFAHRTNTDEWNLFYRRILLADLKCGVDVRSINSVLESIGDEEALRYQIPVFGCQLASPADLNKVSGKVYLDGKLDGVRLVCIWDENQQTTTAYTRNGKVNVNFPHITDQITAVAKAKSLPSLAFDGEVVSGSFQELMTQVNRKSDVDTSDARYAVFDLIPRSDFIAGYCAIDQQTRHANLCQLVADFQATSGVYVVPKLLVDLDTQEGKEQMTLFNEQCLESGLEGMMIKNPLGHYEAKRSKNWMKVKPFITVDLMIIGITEGKGKYKGMTGAFVCVGEHEGKPIRTNVAGMSDSVRRDSFADQSLIGEIIEVRADAVTRAKGSDIYSLRFPEMVRFRSVNREGKI